MQRHNPGMARILKQECIETDEEALALIAREAQGSFRDALSLLDQVIAFNPQAVTTDEVVSILGLTGIDSLVRLMTAILAHDSASSLSLVQELFQQGYDPEQFILDLLRYVRNLLVIRTVPASARVEGMIDAPSSELKQMEIWPTKRRLKSSTIYSVCWFVRKERYGDPAIRG